MEGLLSRRKSGLQILATWKGTLKRAKEKRKLFFKKLISTILGINPKVQKPCYSEWIFKMIDAVVNRILLSNSSAFAEKSADGNKDLRAKLLAVKKTTRTRWLWSILPPIPLKQCLPVMSIEFVLLLKNSVQCGSNEGEAHNPIKKLSVVQYRKRKKSPSVDVYYVSKVTVADVLVEAAAKVNEVALVRPSIPISLMLSAFSAEGPLRKDNNVNMGFWSIFPIVAVEQRRSTGNIFCSENYIFRRKILSKREIMEHPKPIHIISYQRKVVISEVIAQASKAETVDSYKR